MAAGDSVLFDGSDDHITFDAGEFAGHPPDPFSIFAVIKRGSATTYDNVAYVGELGSGAKMGIGLKDLDTLYADVNSPGGQGEDDATGPSTTTTTITSTTIWYAIGYTKAAGENSVPRFHRFSYGLDTWTHEPAGTQMNSVSGVLDLFEIGCWFDDTGVTDFFHGNIGLVAMWDIDLGNDAAVESLFDGSTGIYNLQIWYDAAPLELIRLDAISGIEALRGFAAEVTRVGTTLDTGDMPSGWDDTLSGGPAAQTVLPDADTTTTGWTSTPLFSKVNDASDATVIQATLV